MYQAAIGISRQRISREAGLQAVHQALSQMETGITPTFGLVFFDHLHNPQEIAKGINSLLGDTPVIGISTTGILSAEGLMQNAVGVALFYAEDLSVKSHWQNAYAQSGHDAAIWLKKQLQNEPPQQILAFADAFNGDIEQFLENLATPSILLGALSAGQVQRGRNYQLCDNQSGQGALAALSLQGDLPIAYGYGHGWKTAGVIFRITRSRGFWIRTLDGQPASDAYANWFQFPAKNWPQPPLVSNVRLYPLGLEGESRDDLILRAPLRVEIDGSFRMNATIRNGQDAHLMVGSQAHCLEAASAAANQALLKLGNRRPTMALILVDTAWQLLLTATPAAEIEAVRAVLGPDVPILGAYTLGQIAPDSQGKNALLNNHILVILFGGEETVPEILPTAKKSTLADNQ